MHAVVSREQHDRVISNTELFELVEKCANLGVELQRLEFRPRRRESGEPLRVLIAASFTEKKGIPYALRALGRLGTRSAVEVTVVGDAGPEERFRREKAAILARSPHIRTASRCCAVTLATRPQSRA